MNENPENKSFIQAIWISSIVAIILGLLLSLLTMGRGSVNLYGMVLFCFFPIIAGFVVSLFMNKKNSFLIGTLVLFIVLAILMITQQEGVFCVLMASPLILLALFLGILFGSLFNKPNKTLPNLLVVLFLASTLLIGADYAERPYRNIARVESISNSLEVPFTPEEVWPKIITVDKLSAPKPFLFQVGLPLPLYCTLKGKGVGAIRICHFEKGTIEERVTEWNPPHRIKVKITKVDLPNNHWLDFTEASYQLTPVAKGTQITRITRISSKLLPRFYWGILERWGIESEHRYLLDSVLYSLQQAPYQTP